MATYYVRPDGNDSNTGLGSSAAQAWQTIQKALTSSVLSDVDNYIYVAPGIYRESLTMNVSPSASNRLTVYADNLATMFNGVTAGPVIVTVHASESLTPADTVTLTINTKSSWTLDGFHFITKNAGGNLTTGAILITNGTGWTIRRCVFDNYRSASNSPVLKINMDVSTGSTIERCIILGHVQLSPASSPTPDVNFTINSSVFIGPVYIYKQAYGGSANGGIRFNNCTFTQGGYIATSIQSGQRQIEFYNSLFISLSTASATLTSESNNSSVYENFNRWVNVNRANLVSGSQSTTATSAGLDTGHQRLVGLSANDLFSPHVGSININAGTSTSTPTYDLYNNAWGGAPNIGAHSLTPSNNITFYGMNDTSLEYDRRDFSFNNQSVFVNINIGNLTHTTVGLTVKYISKTGVSTTIPLVAQTATGAYVSGGFCELSAVGMSRIYRIDLPNTVWSLVDGFFVSVNGFDGVKSAALLIEPPTLNPALMHMGPYKLISNNMGADNPLEVLKGVQAPVDVQLVDNSGGGIDITGATVTAKVYNASSQLIDTYTCTPTYALDGRCSFNLDTTVTDNSGHYTVTVTRQVGGNIVVFGPLRCLVRAN